MIYNFTLDKAPDVAKLNADILASSMSVRTLNGLKWNGNIPLLQCDFANEISEWDEILLGEIVNGLPCGSEIWEVLESNGDRWEEHRKVISFRELVTVPRIVELNDVQFNGTADLAIVETTKSNCTLRVSTIGRGYGPSNVAFSWQVKL